MSGLLPFAPALGWVADYVHGLTDVSADSMRRVKIKDDRLLSIPLEGGSSSLYTSANPRISGHGRWQAVHLGAWNAAYGKTPFFQYIFPKMEDIYQAQSNSTLSEFNGALLSVVLEILDFGALRKDLDILKEHNPWRYESLKKEYATKVNYNISIFDTLFRLGKDTVFAMMR